MRTRTTATLLGVAAAAAGSVIALAGPAGAATPGPSIASPSVPSRSAADCDRAPWEARVQGAPRGFSAGDRGGDYLWHDTSGFHLRVTHRNDDRQVYTGVITSPMPMRLDPVKLEGHDVARLSPDRKTLVFAFADWGHIDGLNFHTDCAATVTVSHLTVGPALLPADRIYLGITESHPAAVPFTLHRR
ncbi:MAG TPA: hypothetical protein VHO01_06790 [Jatrophihabitans sp.]|nr:hypothetical protein [Jatrophihabitans sp.]